MRSVLPSVNLPKKVGGSSGRVGTGWNRRRFEWRLVEDGAVMKARNLGEEAGIWGHHIYGGFETCLDFPGPCLGQFQDGERRCAGLQAARNGMEKKEGLDVSHCCKIESSLGKRAPQICWSGKS